MNKNATILIGVIGLSLLLASFAAPLATAFPDEVIREKTFITYYLDTSQPYTDEYNVYAYSGIHWPVDAYVTYLVNPKNAPDGAITEVKNALETWDAQISSDLFNDNVQAANQRLAGNKYDGKNVISWGRLGRNIIAQTTVWYNSQTRHIVEFGMVFSTSYKWNIDPDGEGPIILTGAFDVRDIATHEAGHTLMLDDLYMPEANQLTMYGYGSYGQTYAISLGAGDISGVKSIYP